MEYEKFKVPVDFLTIGMYVAELDRPWIETPFIFQGFLITNENELDDLHKHCKYVFIEREKSQVDIPEEQLENIAKVSVEPVLQNKKPLPYLKQFEEEFPKAKKIYEKVHSQLKQCFKDVRIGRTLKSAEIKHTVEIISQSIVRNPDAMLLMSNMKAANDYMVVHSLNVCILSLTFSRFLGIEQKDMYDLGMGALLHDIGEIRLPTELLNKPTELTAEEYATMQKHTEYGASILRSNGGIPNQAIDIALHHHERIDRSGYPKKLSGHEISRNAKIVGIVDVYDSLTSSTPYRPHISSTDALKRMYDWRGTLFDPTLVESFIQCLGVYPVGSTLELNNGDIGIVISASPENRLHPKMLLVKNGQNKFYDPPKIINLSHFKNSDNNPYEITKIIQPEQAGVDLKRYILRELVTQVM